VQPPDKEQLRMAAMDAAGKKAEVAGTFSSMNLGGMGFGSSLQQQQLDVQQCIKLLADLHLKSILADAAETVASEEIAREVSERCSDCFDRLYLKENSTYETPKIKQFDIESTKDTVTPTEVSLSLNTHGLEELNTNVKKDILQTNVNTNSEDENHFVSEMSYRFDNVDIKVEKPNGWLLGEKINDNIKNHNHS
jgi:hypothetical protein